MYFYNLETFQKYRFSKHRPYFPHMNYTPPFTISQKAINLVAEISAQVEHYTASIKQSDTLLLRKVNRIKTIHSSLAIEGNTLSESDVTDIINGVNIVAPIREIQEVKNAIRAYELYEHLDPFKIDDLLLAHRTLMEALVDDAGHFRQGGVGVFGDKGQIIHLATPASLVPELMKNLFHWLKTAEDNLLIRSCVFHYEFEFIHPFSDGNGRTGRLWQSLILGKVNSVFEHLPVENMIYANQQSYYEAIAESTKQGQSGPFIDFMLSEILTTLLKHRNDDTLQDKLQDKKSKVLACIVHNPRITAIEIGRMTGLGERQVRYYLSALKHEGSIKRIGGNKAGHWEITSAQNPL